MERAEAADTAGIRIPPPLIYLIGLAAAIGLELAASLGDLPGWVRIAGAAIGLACFLALDPTAMARFARARTSVIPFKPATALVTDGPYRLTRNPMYVGMAFLYAGIAFAFALIWALVLLPLVILAVDRLIIAKEEPYLERRFGEPYRAYRSRVRRWL